MFRPKKPLAKNPFPYFRRDQKKISTTGNGEKSLDIVLKDRWQAARDMNGTPIPGVQWVQVDLQRLCTVSEVRVDFETAYCAKYTLEGSNDLHDTFRTLAEVSKPVDKPQSDEPTVAQHVVHKVPISPQKKQPPNPDSNRVRFVRLTCTKRGTRYGVSVWTFDVFGTCS